MRRPCWFAPFSSEPCSGYPERAHLIAKQTLRREVCGTHGRKRSVWERARDADVVWDERVWVWACAHHHARFDQHGLHVPRESLPAGLLEACDEWGIAWALDRRYGGVEVL